MSKIVIDLLPNEFKTEQFKRAKFYKIQTIGVVTILVMTFLSSLTVALRILQSQKIAQIQSKVQQSEQKVSDLKNTQASLLILKNRLITINEYLQNPSKQSQMYQLVLELLPPSVSIDVVSVHPSGEILMFALANDTDSVDQIITNLTTSEASKGKISQISIDGLSRSKDGTYKLTLKIKPT